MEISYLHTEGRTLSRDCTWLRTWQTPKAGISTTGQAIHTTKPSVVEQRFMGGTEECLTGGVVRKAVRLVSRLFDNDPYLLGEFRMQTNGIEVHGDYYKVVFSMTHALPGT
jgi:hypothetical protein